MATHVTHGGAVSTHPGKGQGKGHPSPFAQLPTPADVVEAATALDAFAAAVDAAVVEAASALDAFDADVVAGGAVISADMAEATDASDLADAVSDAAGYILSGFDAAFSITPATTTGYVITGFNAAFVIAPATTTGYAITGFDAAFVVKPVEQEAIGGGGGYYVRPSRPFPVEGVGYGVLPELWGEAHGVVGVAGQSAAQVLVRATAVGACGQAGDAAVVLKGLAVAGKGTVGARGSGEGTIMKFSGSATGQHDDDEMAVIAFLLAA